LREQSDAARQKGLEQRPVRFTAKHPTPIDSTTGLRDPCYAKRFSRIYTMIEGIVIQQDRRETSFAGSGDFNCKVGLSGSRIERVCTEYGVRNRQREDSSLDMVALYMKSVLREWPLPAILRHSLRPPSSAGMGAIWSHWKSGGVRRALARRRTNAIMYRPILNVGHI
ncbi:MAG: hypothetical protein AAFX08_12675, partial [Pseudomonadota bacterium]